MKHLILYVFLLCTFLNSNIFSKEISGFILDENGSKITNAKICIINSSIETYSDEKGFFDIDVPNIGSKIKVCVSKPDFLSKIVDLVPGQEKNITLISLLSYYSTVIPDFGKSTQPIILSGQITDKITGDPVSGALLRFLISTHVAVTDEAGFFIIQIPYEEIQFSDNDQYWIVFEKNGFNSYAKQIDRDTVLVNKTISNLNFKVAHHISENKLNSYRKTMNQYNVVLDSLVKYNNFINEINRYNVLLDSLIKIQIQTMQNQNYINIESSNIVRFYNLFKSLNSSILDEVNKFSNSNKILKDNALLISSIYDSLKTENNLYSLNKSVEKNSDMLSKLLKQQDDEDSSLDRRWFKKLKFDIFCLPFGYYGSSVEGDDFSKLWGVTVWFDKFSMMVIPCDIFKSGSIITINKELNSKDNQPVRLSLGFGYNFSENKFHPCISLPISINIIKSKNFAINPYFLLNETLIFEDNKFKYSYDYFGLGIAISIKTDNDG